MRSKIINPEIFPAKAAKIAKKINALRVLWTKALRALLRSERCEKPERIFYFTLAESFGQSAQRKYTQRPQRI